MWPGAQDKMTDDISDGLTVPPSPSSLPQDQYQLCYRAALEYLGSFDHYATLPGQTSQECAKCPISATIH
ncbi:hypothetical protein INR49_013177 [Caranx melampygus]|nr:hypothetical protein INR49_013177 [Caranx melampygus]